MGTPTEESWSGIEDLPEFKMAFPQWKVNGNENLKKMASNMDEVALDLLTQMVHLEPSKRLSAKEALLHPYFDDFQKENVNTSNMH
jgi:serine/threonine protein kinase